MSRIVEHSSNKGTRIRCTDCRIDGAWGEEELVCQHGRYAWDYVEGDNRLVKYYLPRTTNFLQTVKGREPYAWHITDD